MKRIFVMFLMVVIITSFIFAYSEVDIDSMDLQSLLELEKRVQERIFELDAGYNGVLYSGEYEAGVDLDPGTYVFTAIKIDEDPGYVTVVKWTQDYDVLDKGVFDLGESYQMRLEEDCLITVNDGVVSTVKRK